MLISSQFRLMVMAVSVTAIAVKKKAHVVTMADRCDIHITLFKHAPLSAIFSCFVM